MKMRLKRFSKSAISVVLALCLIFSCASVGMITTGAAQVEGDSVGASAHFYLIGTGTPVNGWGKNDNYKIESDYDTNQWYINAKLTQNGYFALHNGNDQYGPQSNGSEINVGGEYNSPNYNTNGWKFVGETQVVRIVANEGYGSDEWKPQLKLRSIDWYLGGWIEGSERSVADSDYKFTKISNTNYSYTYISTGNTEYVTINDGLNCVYHPESNNSGTGTAASSITGTSGNNSDPKWEITSTTGNRVTVTWNPNTQTLSWTEETTYPITVQSGDVNKGTVESNSVRAGASTAVTIPTATPKYGYKFKQWVATSGLTLTTPTSANEAKVKASQAGTVTAQFEPITDLNLYIAGRFHISNGSGGWTNSFDNDNDRWSNTGDDNIKFTYVSGTTYKVETLVSLSTLSSNFEGTLPPYFFIYDKTNSKYWYCTTSGTELSTSNTSVTLTKYDTQTDSINNTLRFNDSSSRVPVTLFFNTATGVLSFTTPLYYNISEYSGIDGTVTANVSEQKAGETVTLTVTPAAGYQGGTVTVKDASNNPVTVANNQFTMPASDVTITATFTEIKHNVSVKRRFYQSDGTTLITEDSSAFYTISNVGVATTGTVAAAGNETNYTFYKFTLGSGVTGTPNGANSFSVNTVAEPQSAGLVVYIDYKETLHTLTLLNDPSAGGSIKKSGTAAAITSIQVGNVTGVTLVATPSSGYQFSNWSSSSNAVTIGNASNYSTTFKTNADATVTANYTAVDYTISAAANPQGGATVTTTDTSGTQKTGGHIGEQFEIRIDVNSAYALETNPISFTTGAGYATPSLVSGYPKTSNGTVIYRYTLGAGNAFATVNLKAATPTISNVFIKDTSFEFVRADEGEHNTVDNFFRQPLVAKAATDDFSTLSYSNGTTTVSELNGSSIGSNDEVTISPNLDGTLPDSENGTKTYTLTITATNAPSGVTEVSVSQTFIISVSFNDTQKIYFKTKEFLKNCIREVDVYDRDTQNSRPNPYYKTGTQFGVYNAAYDTAMEFICDRYTYTLDGANNKYTVSYSNNNGPQPTDYPAYEASSDDYDAANAIWNNFKNAYDALRLKANTTTIYVLTKYSPSESNPIMLHVWGNDGDVTIDDYNHFKMYYSFSDSYVSSDTAKMDYEGVFEKSGTNYYLYSFTYTGHINFIVWRGTSSTDTTMDGSDKLTGDVKNLREFKGYYINVYNTDVNSTSFTQSDVVDYADFDHTWVNKSNGTKVTIGFEESKTKQDLIDLFSVTPTSSLVTAPVIDTENTTFTITGPVGKSNSTTYDMLNTSADNYTASFPADKPGRYIINYTTKFGLDMNNDPILRTAQMTLWVNSDDINVYVDMNDNVGIPILNIPYYINANNEPVASGSDGATLAYLPYEMDLVTGSESIYKYTIKISKLKSDYKLAFDNASSIPISYITVESRKIYNTAVSEAAPFAIDIEAKTTGEIWFKANSTKLSTFTTISYGRATKSFVAITEIGDNKTILPSAINSMRGTGINTDDDEIYHNQYAALYMLDRTNDDIDNPQLINNFHYVFSASAAQEVKFDGITYYFDKWQILKTPPEGLNAVNGILTSGITTATDFSESASINFTAASAHEDGDYSYVALYKPAGGSDTTVRVEVTYEFEDYDTSDGNYVYDPHKDTVGASYTKVIKVPLNMPYAPTDATYTSFADVKAAVNSIASANLPYVKSNYFDYSYDADHPAVIPTGGENSDENKISVTAKLKETARTYRIVVKKVAGGTVTLFTNISNGTYQNSVTLNNSDFGDISNPVWKDRNGNILAVGNTYKARYVASGFENNDGEDCQIITLTSQEGASVTNKSVVSDSFTEHYYSGDTEMLRHNFYIVDYCAEGKLVGGGVLFATGTYSGNTWSYRQSKAATHLVNNASRERFISDILNNDFTTEYKAQTIDNVGFRYKPFKSTEDVYHYSDDLHAYLTMFEGTNVNSENYDGQKLRLFSFMVYDNNGTNTIVVSDGFAEVDRYINHAA